MPKAYSQDLRDRVITAYTEGTTRISTLSKIFKVGVNAISIWVNRYKATGDYSSKQGVGCGIKPKFTDKQAVISFLKTYPDANAIQIRDVIAPDLHINTFYDSLRRMGVTYKKKNRNISKEMNTAASSFWSS